MRIKNLKSTLRKFSKVIAAVVGIAVLYGGYLFIENTILNRPTREYIVKVNGEKIYKDEFEKEFQNLKQGAESSLAQQKQKLEAAGIDTKDYKNLPDDVLKEYLIKTLIDRKVLATSAKDLKVKVSNAEINKQVADMEKQVGGKSKFAQYIMANGYNLATFKEQLKNEMTISKVQEKIQSQIKISDEEIKKTYERYKYTEDFLDKTFEEAKPKITESLMTEEATSVLSSFIVKHLEKAKIEFKLPEYKVLYDKTKQVIIEKEGYKFTKANLNEMVIQGFFSGQGGYSERLVDSAKSIMEQNLSNLVDRMKKAKEVGIKGNPELVGLFELGDYSKKYYNYIIDTYKPTDAEMQAKFNTNRNLYNIQNTITGYVVGQDYEASEKDWATLKNKAEEVKKTITKDNFATKAKELSQDPGSAVKGGSLGENTDITGFVPEFAEAIKKAKVGEIVGPVKTQFGYHIIYVKAKDSKNENLATVSHILLTPTISDESKTEINKKIAELKTQLDTKKVSWEQVNTQDKFNFAIKEQFKKLSKSDPIPGIGTDVALSTKLFSAKVGETIEHKAQFGSFLLIKTKEVPFKEVSFNDVKERIRLELAFEYANKTIGNIQ